MVKGLCTSCGQEVGTFLKPSGYQCKRCLKIFCPRCFKKIGFLIKNPVCPDCGIVLVRDVRAVELQEEHRSAIEIGRGTEEGKRRAIEAKKERARIEALKAERRKQIIQGINKMFSSPPPKKRRKKR